MREERSQFVDGDKMNVHCLVIPVIVLNRAVASRSVAVSSLSNTFAISPIVLPKTCRDLYCPCTWAIYMYFVCLQIIQAHYPSLQLLSNRMVQACSSVNIPLRCVYINAEIIHSFLILHIVPLSIVMYCFIAIWCELWPPHFWQVVNNTMLGRENSMPHISYIKKKMINIFWRKTGSLLVHQISSWTE